MARELFTVAYVPSKPDHASKLALHSPSDTGTSARTSSSLPQDSQSIPGPLAHSFTVFGRSDVSLLPQDSQPLPGPSTQVTLNASRPVTIYSDDCEISEEVKKALESGGTVDSGRPAISPSSTPLPVYSTLPPSSLSKELDLGTDQTSTDKQPEASSGVAISASEADEKPSRCISWFKECWNLKWLCCCCARKPDSKRSTDVENQEQIEKAHPDCAEL